MEESQIVVDVEASLLSESMQHKLDKLWGRPNKPQNFTIFRAPRIMHKSRKHLFEPSVISIGPFHRGQTSLRAMEEQKWRFLRDFLSRGDHINLDFCISEMKKLEERTRSTSKKGKKKNRKSIFEVGWNHLYIRSDLVLLENQIPFFVVEKLYEIGVKQEDSINFVNELISYMLIPDINYPKNLNPPDQIDHLAHLNHHCSVPNPESPVVLSSKSFILTRMFSLIKYLLLWFLSWVLTWFPRSTSQSLSMAPNSTQNLSTTEIPCATDLQDAGIKFKPKSNPRNIFDISFVQGVLEIPRITIGDECKPLFINLIAFEQCNFLKLNAHFSSYACFLDSLVNTQNDAMILQQCGIIENSLSGEEELTHLFNMFNEGALTETDHFLAELFREVNKHCESSWNRQRAKLVRDYFSSPWTEISLVAALVLLVLTCVQSFFAVYAYFVPPS
ncbi:UPF0481 protein At3g47200-like [Carex rostrata]